MFRHCTIKSSGQRVSRGGKTSTHQHSASSLNHLCDAITNKMNILLLPLAVCFPCFYKYNVFPLTVAFPILTVQVILGRLILLGTATLSNISLYMLSSDIWIVSFFRWYDMSLLKDLLILLLLSSLTPAVIILQYRGVRLSIHIQESKTSSQCQP